MNSSCRGAVVVIDNRLVPLLAPSSSAPSAMPMRH